MDPTSLLEYSVPTASILHFIRKGVSHLLGCQTWTDFPDTPKLEGPKARQVRQEFRREFIPYGWVDTAEAESLRSSLGITVEQDPSG